MKILNALPDYITHIITDSRRVTPSLIESGNVAFVALRTAVGNGHKYIRELYERGLRTFVVDDTTGFENLEDAVFVMSEGSTLDFLIRTAGQRLCDSGVRQIVVTGSHGKTTAKELIVRAFKNRGENVARSPRTWNSAMGAALSIFDNLSRKPRVMVTEIGIDAPGQAERLKPLLRPEIGVITSISDEHDDQFESHAEKIAEKIALVRDAKKIVFRSDDKELIRQLGALKHPNVVHVANIGELVQAVTGEPLPDLHVSTLAEVRRIPEDGILVIDSFVNDLESLPLSLDLAVQRRAGRGLAVFLGDFDGDRKEVARLIKERGGDVCFFDVNDKNFVSTLHRSHYAHKLILVKGATEQLTTFFDEARHDTTLQVDIDALVHNYNTYRNQLPSDTGIVGMVKADAYGLGALEVAKTLQNHGAAYLAVAVVDEGVALRKAGITMPIIVLNPITNRFEALVEYRLEPTVFSLDELELIENALKGFTTEPVPIHIKFDTGMHRVGFLPHDVEELARHLRDTKVVKVASVFSHLATADCPDMPHYTRSQVETFNEMSENFIHALGYGVKRHLLNTAGIETLGKTSAAFDMARLGIGLYGISPVPGSLLRLKPAARLVSTVISLKHWPEGTPIGYGCKGVTHRDSIIATLPIGYADGIDRRLGNGNAKFSVEGVLCPTIGNICMDLLMLDVTDAVKADKDVKVGTEIEIFGKHVQIEEIARTLGTIPYEVLTSVSPRVRRTYHQR